MKYILTRFNKKANGIYPDIKYNIATFRPPANAGTEKIAKPALPQAGDFLKAKPLWLRPQGQNN